MNRSQLLRRLIVSRVGTDQLLLDQYSGAVGAYSLRYLSASYTGNVILVRRSSDDAEQGFTPDEITDGTLTTFCAAGDGLVKTWYDQSGNGNNATQSAPTNQPHIVSSGSLLTQGTKPYTQYRTANSQFMNFPPGLLPGTTAKSSFVTAKIAISSTAIGGNTLYSLRSGVVGTGSAWNVCIESANPFVRVSGAVSYNYTDSDTTYSIFTNIFPGGGTTDDIEMFQNGSKLTLNSSTSATINTVGSTEGIIGDYGNAAGRYSDINMQEIILFNADQSANRAGIETNINNYYGIF